MTDTAQLPRVWVDDKLPEPEEYRGVGLDGPECGTALAKTHLLLVYASELGATFIREGDFCCQEHIPVKSELVPGDADLLILVLEDGVNKTCYTSVDGRVRVVTAPEELIEALMAAT